MAIGWDGGQASAHAVASALPILEKAVKVELLTIGKSPAARSGFRMRWHILALHGVQAVEQVAAGSRAIGEVLSKLPQKTAAICWSPADTATAVCAKASLAA